LPTEWLSLSKAAQLLGVHPGTVRNWSDQGVLPVHRTKGGHRRYRREEVELWMQSQRTTGQNGLDLMVQTALRNTRFKISEGSLNEEAWYNKLDNEAREQYRHSGRAMVQGLIGYIGSNGNIAESEARALGYEYASRARRYNLSMVEATNAFLFFRNVLVESMLAVYEAASVRSPNAWSGLLRKVNAFTDKILTTLLESYEAYPRNNR
jgi:excisionase family DNA binding protein